LSAIRATTVVRYFIEERGVDPERLSVAGYGEYQPIAPNDSPENRSLNRRVNILIVSL
jgi:chemotaxis protein MotB